MKRVPWLAGIVVAFAIGVASADVVDLRVLVNGNPNLINYWTFEGNTVQRLQDSKGTATLSASGTGATAFVPGYDGTTQAFRPFASGLTTGNGGLSTGANNVNIPGSYTLQLLVKPENLVGSPPSIGYAVNQTNNGTNRGYFLATGPAGTTGPNQSFRSIIGGPTFDGVDPVNPYTPGHWYYMAMTFQPSGADTLINTYYADLTAGQTTLTQVSQLETGFIGTSSGSGRSAPVFLGVFQDGLQAGFSGQIDEVAFFNTALNQATIQAMFNTMLPPLAPEPESIVLMVAAFAGLGFFAWKRTKQRRAT